MEPFRVAVSDPVPVDWTDRTGPATVVDVVRVAAKDPARRSGTVVANLGAGNSTAAITGPRSAPIQSWLDQLTKRLDVVVFDPRGLGRDAGRIECPRSPASILGLVRGQDEATWRAHAKENAAYDAGCRQAAGPAFAGLNSWQMAHDLDALRAALGEEKLRYFGNSYGTTYGQAYAELFGARLERLYLDGVADHTQARLVDWLSDHAPSAGTAVVALPRLVCANTVLRAVRRGRRSSLGRPRRVGRPLDR
ncbi:alpha/beta fold hydrolase [Amycolatopsis sp. cmx-11-32]|uniref:alpha/beta fold hydrolase n=1 Tax=Amycolatopsis sp. cmx-11-32 TaxID=2785796 RepID=UPI0039E28D51